MDYNKERALELLRLGIQDCEGQFRDGQEAAIARVVEGRGRMLLVQKTGWGKSSVYFIAVKLLREAGMGPALLISPLLALMRNQIEAAERMGVKAATINSGNQDQWEEVAEALDRNEIDILLISPERQANKDFQDRVLSKTAAKISLLVIDEAHCISDWGHDFRPHYRMIERMMRTMPGNLRLLATTATANNRVLDDLREVLGPNLTVSRGDLSRPSLFLQTIVLSGQIERMAWLAHNLRNIEGSGIIYTLTVRDAEQLSEWLRENGVVAEAYSGRSGDQRPELEQALLGNKLKALVATTALGMGFDKPDLSFVIHYQSPSSVVAYYQQVGRAGRALQSAYGVLLSGEEETEINNFFIRSAFPTPREVEKILAALESESEGISVPGLMREVNVSSGRIQKTLLLLSLESPAPVVKNGSKWILTPGRLTERFWQRAERLTALRKEEQAQMEEYVALKEGHMEFLINALDGDYRHHQQPDLPTLGSKPPMELIQNAALFLKRTNIIIEPRKKWPSGGLSKLKVKGAIEECNRMQPGRALCRWADAGWGTMVINGKYKSQHFPDELVVASAELFQEWQPEPAPEWVTCIPSVRHPELVPEFTRRLAQILGLPFEYTLEMDGEYPEQKSMNNSNQQALNVSQALSIKSNALPGSVLLVDDMVDSRWTVTVAAHLLTISGSGPVHPFALAITSNKG